MTPCAWLSRVRNPILFFFFSPEMMTRVPFLSPVPHLVMPKHMYRNHPPKMGTVIVAITERNLFLVNIHVRYKCLVEVKVICKTSGVLCLLISLGKSFTCVYLTGVKVRSVWRALEIPPLFICTRCLLDIYRIESINFHFFLLHITAHNGIYSSWKVTWFLAMFWREKGRIFREHISRNEKLGTV